MISSESFEQNPVEAEICRQGIEVTMTKEQYQDLDRLLKEDKGITVEEYMNEIILQYVKERKAH